VRAEGPALTIRAGIRRAATEENAMRTLSTREVTRVSGGAWEPPSDIELEIEILPPYTEPSDPLPVGPRLPRTDLE
jgi:hypothetical protein